MPKRGRIGGHGARVGGACDIQAIKDGSSGVTHNRHLFVTSRPAQREDSKRGRASLGADRFDPDDPVWAVNRPSRSFIEEDVGTALGA